MKRKVYHHSTWYCDVVDEEIVWTIGHTVVDMLGGTGSSCCSSASCSRYMREGCTAYGVSDECKSLMEQAEESAIEKLNF